MKGDCVIREGDFDIYLISLPFRLVNRRKRKIFLQRELEKRHPLFSSRFCTNTRYTLKKNCIQAEVAVVDKLKLDEYEKENPGKRLFLEGKNFRFDTEVTGKRKLIKLFLFTGIFAGVAAALFAFNKSQVVPENDIALSVEETEKEEKMVNQLPSAQETLDIVLQRVYEKKGRISRFLFDGEKMGFVLEDCYPEEIISDRPCSLSYRNSSPVFTADFRINKETDFYSPPEEGFCAAKEFQVMVRNCLRFSGALIQSEKITDEETEIIFFCRGERLKDCFDSSFNSTNTCFWHEKYVSVERSGDGNLVILRFAKGVSQENSVLKLLSAYSGLLCEEVSVPQEKIDFKAVVQRENSPLREKIGEIKGKDGKSFTYYRFPDGKIVSEAGRKRLAAGGER